MLAASRDIVLALEGITIDFGRQRAVEAISFTVKHGERCVLMGRSGCGKTTVLKTVGGYVKPSQGQLILNGKPIKRPGPDRMIVWQDLDQLLPWKTVEENVAYPLLILISLQEKFPVTVLFVSHDVNEAVRIGTQIIVLSPGPGRVIAQFSSDTPQLQEKILARIYEDVKVTD